MNYKVFCDGASRSNPGEAAIGVSIETDGKEIHTISKTIGIASNNEAEYLALDSSKSKRRLGWKPVYNVHEALKLTSEWYNCINQKKKLMFVTKKQLQDYLKKIN